MLKLLISLPILGIFSIQFFNKKIGRILGMVSSIITMYISLYMLIRMNNNNIEYQYRDMIDLNYIRIALGVDGISMSLILVTTILIPILILLKERNKAFEIVEIVQLLLVMESMLLFLFSSLDIFFFFLFFELLLIPMFLLIGKYGSKEKRVEAAYRFIGVSIMGSLLMLISIIIIYIKFGSTNNEIMILKLHNYMEFNSLILSLLWLFLFFSFAIKVPIFPFHTWLPFVHVEAPTIGSMLLAGIMLKLGTYGIIRYTISMLGEINEYFLPIVIIMAILSIVYGSLTTIRQIDLKKIIAYSSIVHMNYAILGYYTNEIEGLSGGNYLMISHAFVSCGLFLLIGIIYKRYHSRVLLYYSGLVLTMPIYATFFILFTLANVSLPLTSSFISEILIIISTFKINLFVASLISLSLIFSTTYGLWLSNRLLFGEFSRYIKKSIDMTKTEIIAALPLIIITIILGINTNIILGIYTLPVTNLIQF
jgi:proton-translocating NADH-quinone oxidoreductase chain M